MTFAALLGIAVALAMDAFAVSLTTGVRLQRITPGTALRMAGVFGGFQFVMPVLGWLAGVNAQKHIQAYDHWIAFALLAFVGCKMLREAWVNRGTDSCTAAFQDPTRGHTIWVLGVATSLDALAVGLSLAMLDVNVWFPALVIGLVCFGCTILGLHLGGLVRRLPGCSTLGNKANAFGGLVLLLIGFHILWEHGVFAS